MSNYPEKKRLIGIIIGAAALAIVAGSWAFFTSINEVENELKTAKYGTEMVEKFTPSEDWQPGQEIAKEVGVANTGDYDLFVRVKMSETWTLDDDSELSFDSDEDEFHSATAGVSKQANDADGDTEGDESVVYKALAQSGWTLNTDDGYWYYNSKLLKDATTVNLLSSITLAGDADMGKYTVVNYYTTMTEKPENDVIDDDPSKGWAIYTGSTPIGSVYSRSVSQLSAPGYANASYVLTITSEVMQATQEAFEASGWDVPAALMSAWGIQAVN